MNLDEIIKERHSCRAYLPTEVSDAKLKAIIEAGRLSPSAKNAQPWKFVCIKSSMKQNKEHSRIADLLKNYYLKHKNTEECKVGGASSLYATGKILEDCPAIILVFSDSKYIDRVKVESISDVLSIGSSVEHMMLKATELGLGCLWIADIYYVQKELAEFIEKELARKDMPNFINKGNRLICAMAVGEMGEPRYKTPRKKAKDISVILNYNK